MHVGVQGAARAEHRRHDVHQGGWRVGLQCKAAVAFTAPRRWTLPPAAASRCCCLQASRCLHHALAQIQEDLILPHHYTFYELIINKARGKSGPLFDFGVNEDIRITNDASVEAKDVHAGAFLVSARLLSVSKETLACNSSAGSCLPAAPGARLAQPQLHLQPTPLRHCRQGG